MTKKPKWKPGLFALVSLVLFSACGLRLPGPLAPTPVSTPTCTPIVLPQPTKDDQVKAWVAFERPGLNQHQIVYGKLVRGGQGVAGAEMYSIVHYANLDRRWPEAGFETTAENGIASVSFNILDAGAEDAVTVDVYLVYDGTIFHTTTSFTPHC